MRQILAQWLCRLAAWLDPPSPPPPPPQPGPVELRARAEVLEVERTSAGGTSGEFKRHLVYATLIDTFPHARRRDLAMAIERAVQAVLP